MKVLFMTYDFPYPTISGGKSRAYNLIKQTAKKTDLSLFSFIRDDYKETFSDEMKRIGVKEIFLFPRKSVKNISSVLSFFTSQSIFSSLYYDKKISEQMISRIRKTGVDIMHFESFYTAFYIKEIRNMAKTIYGSENIEYKVYEEYASKAPLPLNFFYKREARKIKSEEEFFYRNADITLSVTTDEKNYAGDHGAKNVAVIENGIDLLSFPFKKRVKKEKKNILFIGNFTYFPNRDAIEYFYRKVFSGIKRNDITLTVIGKNAEKLPFSDKRIRYIDYIDRIQDAYADADIFISPMRYGGGTNYKVLEAMASGVPVIAIPDRIAGLRIKPGVHAFVPNSPEAFKNDLEALLDDYTIGLKNAENARRLVESNFSWDHIGVKLLKVWEDVIRE